LWPTRAFYLAEHDLSLCKIVPEILFYASENIQAKKEKSQAIQENIRAKKKKSQAIQDYFLKHVCKNVW
jgi:hypothetical protein